METKKWFIWEVYARVKARLHPQIDFSKAINFVCHSYNLTDFSLWLMMATVDLQDINIITIIPYRSYSFASHNASLFFLERARKYRLISVHSFFSSLCASRTLLSKLCMKNLSLLMLSVEKGELELFKSHSINHNVTFCAIHKSKVLEWGSF